MKATNLPVLLRRGTLATPADVPPPVATEMSELVWPTRSRSQTSPQPGPSVQPEAWVDEMNATYRPSALIEGASLRRVPPAGSPTSTIETDAGALVSATATTCLPVVASRALKAVERPSLSVEIAPWSDQSPVPSDPVMTKLSAPVTGLVRVTVMLPPLSTASEMMAAPSSVRPTLRSGRIKAAVAVLPWRSIRCTELPVVVPASTKRPSAVWSRMSESGNVVGPTRVVAASSGAACAPGIATARAAAATLAAAAARHARTQLPPSPSRSDDRPFLGGRYARLLGPPMGRPAQPRSRTVAVGPTRRLR